MNGLNTSILVALNGPTVTMRISGRANCTGSCDFKTAVHELYRRGYHHFVFDLSNCLVMDSTFLGVLAGFALHTPTAQDRSNGYHIELINPNPRVADLIDNLGVSHLFLIRNGAAPNCSGAEALTTDPTQHSKVEVCRTSLEAHETLMKLSDDNVNRFKDVTRFLAEDLKRLESDESNPS